MDPLKRSDTSITTSPPPETKDVQSSGTSLDGRVKSIPDALPKLAGKNLGKHLNVRGFNAFKMAFTHPKALFHLLSGRLDAMKQTNPVKYMEELTDLSTRPEHFKFTIAEGNQLKAANHRVKDQIEGYQRTAVNQMARYTSEAYDADDFIEAVRDLGECCKSVSLAPMTMLQGPAAKSFDGIYLRIQQLNHSNFMEEQEQFQVRDALLQIKAARGRDPKNHKMTRSFERALKPLNANLGEPPSTPAPNISSPTGITATTTTTKPSNLAVSWDTNPKYDLEEVEELLDLNGDDLNTYVANLEDAENDLPPEDDDFGQRRDNE
ncbi:hypothetical protein [Parendozoicomonas haliclonae]|uniref:Uncharacterized protein n=1 Tax=Parendozoicomonas haliclonae TaxID=1960125 RepID=A0A1X7ANJ8_9GAMM|nr:hypothetical protein [Parendozoicomonas haliclonae]SMA49659.1 hypothetical protein EHSB41UT_03441 [Parendozoicomonas haliclonae]